MATGLVCGPTSVAMVLAYYGELAPWNVYQQERLAGYVPPTAADGPLTGGGSIRALYNQRVHAITGTPTMRPEPTRRATGSRVCTVRSPHRTG